jgi:hypothetical protein
MTSIMRRVQRGMSNGVAFPNHQPTLSMITAQISDQRPVFRPMYASEMIWPSKDLIVFEPVLFTATSVVLGHAPLNEFVWQTIQ